MAYVLGVDGGNTKTDYMLYTLAGDLAGHLRAGSCSHEKIGLDGARREMGARIAALLAQTGVRMDQISAAAFGLAGIDQPVQRQALEGIVHGLGFANSVAMNDSFLGIKAGSESGIGVCSINGTGTASGGLDSEGHWMQVGGYGTLISGDEGGGPYVAGRAIRAAYDEVFRFGPATALTPAILKLFGCQTRDDLHTQASVQFVEGDTVQPLEVINILFATADAGDTVAVQIVRDVADALARSAAGCAARLRFGDTIPVILIGSVWTKGRYQPMIDHFKRQFEGYAGKAIAIHILDVPPAVGSVLWALELATGKVPTGALREKVFAQAEAVE